MLDLEDCRRAFADRLARCADEKQSFERALMAACEFAYRRGLEDGVHQDRKLLIDSIQRWKRRAQRYKEERMK